MNQLEVIWQQYAANLLYFIKKRVSDPAIAEDIRQEVFVKMITKIKSIKDQTKIESWLFSVTRNSIIDYYRNNKSASELPNWIHQIEEADESKAQRELSACLEPMISRLPEKYRFAIHMSEIEGKNQKEIAESENISLSGAKSRVQRGRHLLKEMLHNCCEIQLNKNNQLVDYQLKDSTSSSNQC